MNGMSLFARSLIQRDIVDMWSRETTNAPWTEIRYFRLSSSFCDDNADGWVEMTGDDYEMVTTGNVWFGGWSNLETEAPDYNTGGYLVQDIVFPINTGDEWPSTRQIGVFGNEFLAGSAFVFGAQIEATKIGNGQRLVLLSGDNPASSYNTAGLVAINKILPPT